MPTPKPEKVTIMVTYNTGTVRQVSAILDKEFEHLDLGLDKNTNLRLTVETTDIKRTYDRDQPVALDQRDPSNTSPDELTEPLAADDDIYTLVHQDQGDIREIAPVGENQ